MKNERGITLVELLVVIAVIGILVIAMGIEFVGWMGGYKIEKETKDIHSDMMDARTMALSRSRDHCIQLIDGTSYRMILDANNDGDCNDVAGGGDTVVATFPKTIEHPMLWNGVAPANTMIQFNRRGIITGTGTLRLTTASTNVETDYDCINVTATQVNMGDWNAGACNEK